MMRDENCSLPWDSSIDKAQKDVMGARRKSDCVQVQDARGVWWDVKEARPTKHGFDVLYGHRVSRFGPGGSPKLILTKELKQYWEENAINHGTITDLPIPPTTRKRARKRYKLNYFDDIAQFWKENMEDVKTLTPRQFSRKHDMAVHKVRENYFRILGRRARPIGWWKEPRVLEALLSRRTHVDVARQLGIGTSQVHRLRVAAQALGMTREQQNPTGSDGPISEEVYLDRAA